MPIRLMKKSDFDVLLGLVDIWWGGRNIQPLLHPVYFYQFGNMAFVAEQDGRLTGFLIGLVSQNNPEEAYVHLVGTAPDLRKQGTARLLYKTFFDEAKVQGCCRVKAITSPINQGSIEFHKRLGFSCALEKDYSGPSQGRVVFVRDISPNSH